MSELSLLVVTLLVVAGSLYNAREDRLERQRLVDALAREKNYLPIHNVANNPLNTAAQDDAPLVPPHMVGLEDLSDEDFERHVVGAEDETER